MSMFVAKTRNLHDQDPQYMLIIQHYTGMQYG